MSIFSAFGSRIAQIARTNLTRPTQYRHICLGSIKFCDVNDETAENKDSGNTTTSTENNRRQIIPVETSIRYLQSDAYKQTYGDEPVWVPYRRNFKGQIPPRKTRKTCIRGGVISTGSPCPICRDEFLVLHHLNLDLLKQFISPFTGEVLSYSKTGLCQRKHLRLLVTIERAYERGLLTYQVPFRKFNYEDYYGKDWKQQSQQ